MRDLPKPGLSPTDGRRARRALFSGTQRTRARFPFSSGGGSSWSISEASPRFQRSCWLNARVRFMEEDKPKLGLRRRMAPCEGRPSRQLMSFLRKCFSGIRKDAKNEGSGDCANSL